MNARIEFATEVFVGLQQDLEETREVLFTEEGRRALQCGALVRCGCDQIGIRARDASDENVADVTNRLAAEVLEVAAFFLKAVDESESAVSRAGGNGVDEFFERIFGNDSEKFANLFGGNGVAAVGARLFKQ